MGGADILSKFSVLLLHLQQQAWIRSKNMIKVLEPGPSPLRYCMLAKVNESLAP